MMKSSLAILITMYFLLGCDSRDEKTMEVPVEIEFTESDLNYFNQLSQYELELIDNTLYSHTSERWQKIAMVIAKSLKLRDQFKDLNDVKLLLRVHHLINTSKLESQGNIKAMRFSEVKRK
ncbi:DUF3658 domain-containing protein [Pseudoalteromonas sp. Bsw20308]|uniref:DUF3658 domain-containing protein n=1 Tax=Pseudoalteromonas sp. Bsw20308 TaxID=283699 RepID=UPI00143BFEA4|nr:DUF3658 domain-containing protein [Pseudoalteromonas sp. Bsw20308]